MGVFRHPHLVRGIVHTPRGSFEINRGLVTMPDDVGESYGWRSGVETAQRLIDHDALLTALTAEPKSRQRKPRIALPKEVGSASVDQMRSR